MSCFLCAALDCDPDRPLRHVVSDDELDSEILHEELDFSVMLDVAPISEGHLLLLTNDHVPSFASLPSGAIARADALLRYAVDILEKVYNGPVLAFEHGSDGLGGKAGGCIDHAHIHVMPNVALLTGLESWRLAFRALKNFGDVTQFAGAEYFMMRDSSAISCAIAPASLPTQLARKLLASNHDAAPDWRESVRLGARREQSRTRLRSAYRRLKGVFTPPSD